MTIHPRTTAKGKTVYDVRYKKIGGNWTCRRGLPLSVAQKLDRDMNMLSAMHRLGMKLPPTLSELADDWLEFIRKRLAASTVKGYEYDVENRLKPLFGERLITEITPREIQAYVDSLAPRPRTANKSLACLKGMYKQAVIWGYLDISPAHQVRAVPEVSKERDFLTYSEAQDVLGACEGQDRLFILTGLLSGLRPGELAGLKWDDIAGKYIHVRRSFSGGDFTKLKSKHARRDVLIPYQLTEALEKARGRPHYLVFTDEPNGPLPGWKMTRHIVIPAVKKAGVQKHITAHDLRHTYCCWLISQGEPIKFVQEQVGHYSPEFTMKRYGHIMPDTRTEVMRRFERRVQANLDHAKKGEGAKIIEFPGR